MKKIEKLVILRQGIWLLSYKLFRLETDVKYFPNIKSIGAYSQYLGDLKGSNDEARGLFEKVYYYNWVNRLKN